MDWIRANKTQATILGIFGVIALALGVMLYLADSDYGASLDELGVVNGKLASKEKANLYPSEEHVDQLEAKVSDYEESVGKLSSVLLKLQAEKPVVDINDTAFQAKLKERINALRQSVGAGSKVLPKGFAFGFETYTISLPRSPEAAKELNDYFDTVDAVVTTAIDAGVRSIDSIHRTELAIEKGAPTPTSAGSPPKKAAPKPPATKKGKGKAKAVVPVAKPVTKVVEKRTLTLKLTTDQAPLQALLNALASPSKMPYFTVVRVMRVENEKQDGPLKAMGVIREKDSTVASSATAAPPPVDPNGAPTAPTVEVLKAATPSDKDAMIVMGGEKLRVYLEIDLVRFVEPASEAQ